MASWFYSNTNEALAVPLACAVASASQLCTLTPGEIEPPIVGKSRCVGAVAIQRARPAAGDGGRCDGGGRPRQRMEATAAAGRGDAQRWWHVMRRSSQPGHVVSLS